MSSRFALALALASLFCVLAPARADDLRGALFRSADDSVSIKIVSEDELEFTPEPNGPHLVCKYTRDGNVLRAVMILLGSQ